MALHIPWQPIPTGRNKVFGAKPFAEPTIYCQLHPQELSQVKI